MYIIIIINIILLMNICNVYYIIILLICIIINVSIMTYVMTGQPLYYHTAFPTTHTFFLEMTSLCSWLLQWRRNWAGQGRQAGRQ